LPREGDDPNGMALPKGESCIFSFKRIIKISTILQVIMKWNTK